jgi:hypothetical protein
LLIEDQGQVIRIVHIIDICYVFQLFAKVTHSPLVMYLCYVLVCSFSYFSHHVNSSAAPRAWSSTPDYNHGSRARSAVQTSRTALVPVQEVVPRRRRL